MENDKNNEKFEKKVNIEKEEKKYKPYNNLKGTLSRLDYSMIFAWVFVLLLTVIVELGRANFELSTILTAEFWSNVVILNAGSALLMWMTANKWKQIKRAQSKKRDKLVEEIDNTLNNDVYEDLPEFISEDNQDRKKREWLTRINRKIYKLDQKATQKDIDIYNSNDDEIKQKNRYCKKRAKLLEKTTPEWLEQNLPFMKIKYNQVTESAVMTGADSKNSEYTPINENKQQLVDLLPNIMIGTVFTMLFATLIWDLTEPTIGTIIFIIFKLGIIIYRQQSGKNYGLQYIDKVEIPQLYDRKSYLKKYLRWRINKKKKQGTE